MPDVVSRMPPPFTCFVGKKRDFVRLKRFETAATSTSNHSGCSMYARVMFRAVEESMYTGASTGISPRAIPCEIS